MENVYRERMRSDRCSERERIQNQSVQSACLPIFPHNHPTPSCLSLSFSLYRSPVSHVVLCGAIPPLHLPVSLSFSVVSHSDTNPVKIPKFKQDIQRDEGRVKPALSNDTKIKKRSDLLGQCEAWGSDCSAGFVFSLFFLKSSVHKHFTVLHIRT